MLIESCVCGSGEFQSGTKHEIPVMSCVKCGVDHQVVDMTSEEYEGWYKDKYLSGVYTHTYEQDRSVAKLRAGSYGELQEPILDLGSGNGAFVDELLYKDYDVYELALHAPENKACYSGNIFDAKFPSGYFSTITAHDVIEHVVDLNGTIAELARIIADGGRLIVDFPAFYTPSGAHHWKLIEHIWMMKPNMLTKLFSKAGFKLTQSWEPVPGKFTLVYKKVPQKRTTILVPPGVGDSFWCITKIQSMAEVEGFGIPEVQIASTRGDRDRSFDFVKRFPFLNCTGYFDAGQRFSHSPIWREAYHEDGDGVFENVLGFDWFLSTNGPFRFNKTLNEIMPRYETDWYPPMFVSAEERHFAQGWQSEGPYVVVFITSVGPYRNWIREYSVSNIASDLKKLRAEGLRVVLTGAHWDVQDPAYVALWDLCKPFALNMIGKTSMAQFLGLLRGATGTYGFCGGNTIFSTVLRKPTIILWNDYYNGRFHTASCPPDSLGKWYMPVNTKEAADRKPANMLLKLIRENNG